MEFTENQIYNVLEEMQTDHSGMEVWDHPLSESHQNLDLIEITALVEDAANARATTDGSLNIVSSTGKLLIIDFVAFSASVLNVLLVNVILHR